MEFASDDDVKKLLLSYKHKSTSIKGTEKSKDIQESTIIDTKNWKKWCSLPGNNTLFKLRDYAKELNIEYNIDQLYSQNLYKNCKKGYINNLITNQCVLIDSPTGQKLLNKNNVVKLSFEKKILCQLITNALLKKDENSCPIQLQPIDGKCPSNLPYKFNTIDNKPCCFKVPGVQKFIGNIKKNIESKYFKFPYKLSEQQTKINEIQKTCQNINIYDILNKVRNIKNKSPQQICDIFHKTSIKKSWIEKQKKYFDSLPNHIQQILKDYTGQSYEIINEYLRTGYLNNNMLKLLKKYNTSESDLNSVFYDATNAILNAPVTENSIIVYRKNKDKKHFDGIENNIYENRGILSTSYSTRKWSGQFWNIITIPKGYSCLYAEYFSYNKGEKEILLPDKSMYYITQDFREMEMYHKSSNINTIFANHIILISQNNKFNSYINIQISDLLFIKELGGSTVASLVEYDDKNFVFKTAKTVGQLKTEILANRLYKAAGMNIPNVYPVYNENKLSGLILDYIDGSHKYSEKNINEIDKKYILHVLFENWDANQPDNHIVSKDGKVYLIDTGGTMQYRAQGDKKKFDENVTFDGIAKYASKFFQKYKNKEYLKKGICKEWKKVNQNKIMETLIENREFQTLENVEKIMKKRMENIDNYCKK